jgi:hypothetical protein
VESTRKAYGGIVSVEVSDVPEAKRYEARIEGESEVAGVADYIRTAELVAFAANLRVLAICPFFAGWIARHPEYKDLLYQSRSRVSD